MGFVRRIFSGFTMLIWCQLIICPMAIIEGIADGYIYGLAIEVVMSAVAFVFGVIFDKELHGGY